MKPRQVTAAPLAREDLTAAAWQQMLAAFEPETCPFDPCETTAAFVARYGLKLDGAPFDLTKYEHLQELYEDESDHITVMAAAQSGKSGWVQADLVRQGVKRWGGNLGYYFPDSHLPKAFSRGRFAPMVRASPDLRVQLGRATGEKDDVDQIQTRSFGPTTFFFLSVAGVSSTEGLPMRGVFFDEVRRMSKGDIQRAEERLSAQADPVSRYVSTAFLPNEDIHRYFVEGDQRYFHSDCRCADGVCLTLTWPECVLDLRACSPELRRRAEHAFTIAGLPLGGTNEKEREAWGEACYWCPRCGTILTNPRQGWWVAHAPHHRGRRSYQLPQLLSPVWPAARILTFYRTPGIDLGEFYNSKLGLPHLDTDASPVTDEVLAQSVDPTAVWAATQTAEWRKTELGPTAMGADIQRGYLVAVIKRRTRAGYYETVHVQVVHEDRGHGDPWRELARMMLHYDVRVCVLDAQPEYDNALRFARAFRGRVWLAQYVEGGGQGQTIVSWGHRQRKKTQQGDTKNKYIVNVNRTLAFQWSLGLWRQRAKTMPPPDGLVVELPTDDEGQVIFSASLGAGRWRPVAVARAYMRHLKMVAIMRRFRKDDKDGTKTGVIKREAVHVGGDPHFAHADLYADVALSQIAPPLGGLDPASMVSQPDGEHEQADPTAPDDT